MNARHPFLGFVTIIVFFASTSQAVTISTVPVGYAGNSADPATGSLYGAVPYDYRIGTYDVTYSQYAEFFNAKASAADSYQLWDSFMDTSTASFAQGITRSGSPPYVYTVAP